jgi:hypothetical protein
MRYYNIIKQKVLGSIHQKLAEGTTCHPGRNPVVEDAELDIEVAPVKTTAGV